MRSFDFDKGPAGHRECLLAIIGSLIVAINKLLAFILLRVVAGHSSAVAAVAVLGMWHECNWGATFNYT